MHSDPKREAQITEEAGLTAESEAIPSVTNPDAPGEEGIETAAAKQNELDRKAAVAKTTAPTAPRGPTPSLDRLDRERATDEGMAPPSTP